ncbi:hypothetical protein TRIUR3_28632 [Triticum urartu]|uniref:Uncharacterized protein n=1 Tax=Triticum urartu TaxID=4572 RepID=M7YYR6_TRIUA|nr:hypothetical protein TRIUR3_28632 [Triticum urartu]
MAALGLYDGDGEARCTAGEVGDAKGPNSWRHFTRKANWGSGVDGRRERTDPSLFGADHSGASNWSYGRPSMALAPSSWKERDEMGNKEGKDGEGARGNSSLEELGVAAEADEASTQGGGAPRRCWYW